MAAPGLGVPPAFSECPLGAIDCAGSDYPISNYTSAAPDSLLFWGNIWPGGGAPALGSNWTVNGCFGMVQAATEEAALAAATVASQTCAQQWTITGCFGTVSADTQTDVIAAATDAWYASPNCSGTMPDWKLAVQQSTITDLFANAAQTCTVPCASGGTYTFTLPAGWVVETSPDLANQIAYSIACNQSLQNRACPPPIPPSPHPGYRGQPFNGNTWACLDDTLSSDETLIDLTGQAGAPWTITISSGTLPDGVDFIQDSATTAVLIGQWKMPGVYNFTVKAVSGLNGGVVSLPYSFAVIGLLNNSLPDATVGIAYSAELVAAGGFAPDGGPALYTFTLLGSLPDGLSLASDGTVSGTPRAPSAGYFEVSIRDLLGRICKAFVSINVKAVIYPSTLPNAVEYDGSYSYTLVPVTPIISGGNFVITAGALPTGMALNRATGNVYGPAGQLGTFSFTVHLTADNPAIDGTQVCRITVTPLAVIYPSTLPNAVEYDGSYSYTLVPVTPIISGGNFVITAGALPTGMALNRATGNVYGPAGQLGTFSFTVHLTADNPAIDGTTVCQITVTPFSCAGQPESFPSVDQNWDAQVTNLSINTGFCNNSNVWWTVQAVWSSAANYHGGASLTVQMNSELGTNSVTTTDFPFNIVTEYILFPPYTTSWIDISSETGGDFYSSIPCNVTVSVAPTPAPPPPVAIAATNITGYQFTANWNPSLTALGYFLDVSTDSAFGSFLPGHNSLDVGNVLTIDVLGLTPGTLYYYRLRAYIGPNVSANSNTISAQTLIITWVPNNVGGTYTTSGLPVSFPDLATFRTVDPTTVTDLNLSGAGITSITNLSTLTALVSLECDHNALSALDVSGCVVLKNLYCNNTDLTALSVAALGLLILDCSNNALMTTLDCSNNHVLNMLNLTGCTALTSVDCTNNHDLSSLNISTLVTLTYLQLVYCGFTPANAANSVDDILHNLVLLGQTGGYVEIDGGTNAAPTLGPSNPDVLALQAETPPWSVFTN